MAYAKCLEGVLHGGHPEGLDTEGIFRTIGIKFAAFHGAIRDVPLEIIARDFRVGYGMLAWLIILLSGLCLNMLKGSWRPAKEAERSFRSDFLRYIGIGTFGLLSVMGLHGLGSYPTAFGTMYAICFLHVATGSTGEYPDVMMFTTGLFTWWEASLSGSLLWALVIVRALLVLHFFTTRVRTSWINGDQLALGISTAYVVRLAHAVGLSFLRRLGQSDGVSQLGEAMEMFLQGTTFYSLPGLRLTSWLSEIGLLIDSSVLNENDPVLCGKSLSILFGYVVLFLATVLFSSLTESGDLVASRAAKRSWWLMRGPLERDIGRSFLLMFVYHRVEFLILAGIGALMTTSKPALDAASSDLATFPTRGSMDIISESDKVKAQLVRVNRNGQFLGTACRVSPGVYLTVRHVAERATDLQGAHDKLQGFQVIETGSPDPPTLIYTDEPRPEHRAAGLPVVEGELKPGTEVFHVDLEGNLKSGPVDETHKGTANVALTVSHGDSGSPVMVNFNGKLRVAGVISRTAVPGKTNAISTVTKAQFSDAVQGKVRVCFDSSIPEVTGNDSALNHELRRAVDNALRRIRAAVNQRHADAAKEIEAAFKELLESAKKVGLGACDVLVDELDILRMASDGDTSSLIKRRSMYKPY